MFTWECFIAGIAFFAEVGMTSDKVSFDEFIAIEDGAVGKGVWFIACNAIFRKGFVMVVFNDVNASFVLFECLLGFDGIGHLNRMDFKCSGGGIFTLKFHISVRVSGVRGEVFWVAVAFAFCVEKVH